MSNAYATHDFGRGRNRKVVDQIHDHQSRRRSLLTPLFALHCGMKRAPPAASAQSDLWVAPKTNARKSKDAQNSSAASDVVSAPSVTAGTQAADKKDGVKSKQIVV